MKRNEPISNTEKWLIIFFPLPEDVLRLLPQHISAAVRQKVYLTLTVNMQEKS